jgi:SpoVK/Ycf46/Vps4 family AAA+-type ATPase
VKEQYAKFGIRGNTGGVLLHGPPGQMKIFVESLSHVPLPLGNSKTRLVMAAASSRGIPLISLSAADVYSAYVGCISLSKHLMCTGDAEAEIRRTFRLARQARPCIIFFDEIDAIVTNRFVKLKEICNFHQRYKFVIWS